MTSESDSGSVLYASVSCGPIILAELLPTSDDSYATGDLSALAVLCIDAAPRFHLLYTHTAGSRIYAFLVAEPLLLFAISEESLGRSAVLLFLHRLRDATAYIARRRIDAGDAILQRCLQDELLPVIRRVAAGSVSLSEDEKPSTSLPPALSSSPPLPSTPPFPDSLIQTGEHKRKVKKERKNNPKSDEGGVGNSRGGDEHEIPVTDNDGGTALNLGLGGRKSMQRIWWQQVRIVLIIDLVVCSLLFGIWLSVCKGFQCIAG